MFSRRNLKWGLSGCLIMLALTVLLSYNGGKFSLREKDALYFIETGSAVSAVAISIALVATI
jgi:hypothetical protein